MIRPKSSLTYLAVFFAILIGFFATHDGIKEVRRLRNSRRLARRKNGDIHPGGNIILAHNDVGGQ